MKVNIQKVTDATVFYLGIREQRFTFQREAYTEIARRWCKDNGLEIE